MTFTQSPAISLILPAYNERARITTTIREAADYFRSRVMSYEIIVSADGTDGTREAAAELTGELPTLRVIGGPERKGKGRGIRHAVQIATGDVVGFSDADNKTPITELDKVLPLFDAGADLVIGSRGLATSRIEKPQPLYRQLGSRGFRALLRLLVGLYGITDTQCGFKFFRRAVAADLFSRQQIDGYMFDVEILYLARAAGYALEQVPIRWRDDGDSRLVLVSGNVRNLIDIVKIRLRGGRSSQTKSAGGRDRRVHGGDSRASKAA